MRIPATLALAALLAGLGGCEVDESLLVFDQEVAKLANPGPPPADHSNKYLGDVRAESLGKRFYFDADFSGRATLQDMLLQTMTTPGRAPLDEPIRVSCNTCHDVTRGGSDSTADPLGHRVSFGAGAYDVNGQQTFNSAYGELVYWNGRNDSLWSQIVAVAESHVSMAGSRVQAAWRIADAYRAEYEAIFGAEYPLPPELDSVAAQKARLEPDGSCKLVSGSCPQPHCRTVEVGGTGYCLPRFPLFARPGYVAPKQAAVCSWGAPADPLQPDGDAYDCMDLADQLAVTRIYVNFAKAIAAYEYTLISRDSAFDRYVSGGKLPTGLTAAAQRGLRLFVGKAACSTCHSGATLSDNKFHNIGLPQVGDYVPTLDDCPRGSWCDCVSDDRPQPINCLPWGYRDGLRKLQANKFRRDSRWSDDALCQNHATLHIDPNYAQEQPGECDGMVKYYAAPLLEEHKGAWKTPGLRDVALTAPYMHNGMFATLRQVIDHYDRGGVLESGSPIGPLDPKIKPLFLSEQEKGDLEAFMGSLSGVVDPAAIAPPELPPPSGL